MRLSLLSYHNKAVFLPVDFRLISPERLYALCRNVEGVEGVVVFPVLGDLVKAPSDILDTWVLLGNPL